MELQIQHTWDGAPLGTDEIATVTVARVENGLRVRVEAPFHGDAAPDAAPGPVDGLWNFEVVELFILGRHDKYLEVEFGPHGHHLALRLEGVRHAVERAMPMPYTARIEGARWHGEAEIPDAWLPLGPYCVNAYAIHCTGAARRYLAWTPVPGPAPDFHRLEHVPPVELP